MLTAAQLMDGSRTLATAAKLREEHAKCAKASFDRAMYAQAAETLHTWSEDLERWSRFTAEHESGANLRAPDQLEGFSRSALAILAQLQPAKVEAGV